MTFDDKLLVNQAAHCVTPLSDNTILGPVRLGEYDTSKDEDCDYDIFISPVCAAKPIDIAIEYVIVHPNYKARFHDLALIRMAREVEFSSFIKPICLPTRPLILKDRQLIVAGENRDCFASKIYSIKFYFPFPGWGKNF